VTLGNMRVLDVAAAKKSFRIPSLLMRARAHATVRVGKNDWSAKLIRGLTTEQAAGFQS
jgi:hypothetical protein